MLRPSLLALLLLVAACADTPEAKAPQPPATVISRVGTVAVVQIVRETGLTTDNWATVIKGSLRNEVQDRDVNTVKMIYEVTVFFGPGEQEVIKVDADPGVRAGQRVRVTGNKIEPIGR